MTLRIALFGAANSIHLQRWALALMQRGHTVCVLTQHHECAREQLPSAVELVELPRCGPAGYFMNARFVRHFLAKWEPDILHAHYASGYGTTARLVGFRPWLLSVWGSDVYDFPRKSPMHHWLVKTNLLLADAVASTSHCMAVEARRIAPGLRDIAITPFGVDMADFGAAVPVAQAQPGHWVVGTVKTMDHAYGVDMLIRAFALLLRKLAASDAALAEQLHLRLVGDGPQTTALQHLASKLGIADKVEFAGRVPHHEVPQALAGLDIYVALSRSDSESFGVAIIEAGAAGRPVVVSDAGGLPEVTVNGLTGLVVPRENPQAAADAIERLLRDADLRRRMGEAAQLHVAQHYSWPACVATMLGVYERVIAQYRSSET